jgi:hypothetical protein
MLDILKILREQVGKLSVQVLSDDTVVIPLLKNIYSATPNHLRLIISEERFVSLMLTQRASALEKLNGQPVDEMVGSPLPE